MYPGEHMFQAMKQQEGIVLTYTGRKGPSFNLSKSRYKPDFHLPGTSIYYEVVGTPSVFSARRHVYQEFRDLYPHLTLFIIKPDGTELDPRKPYYSDRTLHGVDARVQCI